LAAERLDLLTIRIRFGDGSVSETTYRAIEKRLEELCRAAPACAECLRSGGHRKGSYHSISYPIDSRFEQLAFEFFREHAANPNSICSQFFHDILEPLPSEGLMWHEDRGPNSEPTLAELPEVLRAHVAGLEAELDSGRALAALFRSPSDTAELIAYGLFWHEFAVFARLRDDPDQSRTLAEVLGLEVFFQLAFSAALNSGAHVLVDA
jgi:hypothetical protein